MRMAFRHSLLLIRRRWRRLWRVKTWVLLGVVMLVLLVVGIFFTFNDDVNNVVELKTPENDVVKPKKLESHMEERVKYPVKRNYTARMGHGDSHDWISGRGQNVKGLVVGAEEMLRKVSGSEGLKGMVEKRRNGERCYVVGYNPNSDSLWQMNSRALCYVEKMCFSGKHLDNLKSMGWLNGKGMSCYAMRAGDGRVVESEWENMNRGKRCSEVVRKKLVMGPYGEETMDEGNLDWLNELDEKHYGGWMSKRMKALEFKSKFAIVVPKYEWTHNICHYSRVWNYIAHVIRHLKDFGITAEDHGGRVDVLFRSGMRYGKTWMTGMRDALVEELQKETGLEIVVGKLRYDRWREAQCLHKALLLGLEGRVDSFAFLNDTDVWERRNSEVDGHWPSIPRQSLLLRQAVSTKYGFDPMAKFINTKEAEIVQIKVPPKRIAYVLRSPRSRRRFGPETKMWFQRTLKVLAEEMGFEVEEMNFASWMAMKEQVGKLRNAGIATGIHGANFVNTMFMPPASALIEMFPYRYARAYYLNGGNSGLRYSYHETRTGKDHGKNFLKYRESRLDFNGDDREQVFHLLKTAMLYISKLHERFPQGVITLEKMENDDSYQIPRPIKKERAL